MFTLVGGVPVIIPQGITASQAKTKPLESYQHSIDYHLHPNNPHAVTTAMLGLSADDTVASPPVSEPKRKEFEMEGLNRIKYSSNWGGGAFVGGAIEGASITVLGKRGELVHGTLAKGDRIYGADHDHGHTYNWEFQDLDVTLENDPFDRKSSLLRILKAEIPVFAGQLTHEQAMRYRDHRGGLDESMGTVVVMLRTMDALVEHLNTKEYFLNRKIVADDLEFHVAGFDDRTGWNTVWVKLKGFGVLGCIDGEIK